MRAACRSIVPAVVLLAALCALALGGLTGSQARAASGHWRFTGYTITPAQAQLDAIARANAGRIFEQRVTGAFQPATSGAGSVESFFKADDADGRVFLTTLRFSFTTGAPMKTLTPGQVVRFKSVLVMGGNALSQAVPASGFGKMALDNGDYFLTADGAINRSGGAEGEVRIPGGGPGATMTIYAIAYQSSYGALTARMNLNYEWVANP